MFGKVIEICSSVVAIAAATTISLAFLFIICMLIKKCIDIFKN